MDPAGARGIGGHDLGELVYTKRVSARRMKRITTVGVVGLLATAVLLPFLLAREDPLEGGILLQVFIFAAAATLGLPLGLYQSLIASRRVVYFHRRGLRQTGLGRERVISYDQVVGIAYKTTRVFVRYYLTKVYSETRQKLRLRLASGERLRLRHTFIEDPEPSKDDHTPAVAMELETGALAVAEVLADRMRRELDAGRIVPWTAALSLTPAGLELASTGERHGWDRIGEMGMAEGTLLLRLGGQDKPMKIPTSEENFWPGYTVLCERLAAPGGAGAAAEDRPPEAPIW